MGTYLSNRMVRLARSLCTSRLSIHDATYGFQPKSDALMKRMPARDTVAGVAVFRCEISNSRRIVGVSGMRSLLASVSTLLSSITVFSDSIHIGSMSPSKMIHLGPSCDTFARSRIMLEKRPSRHSRVDGFTKPNSSLFVTAFGFRSVATGRRFWFWYVRFSVFHT